MRRDERVETRIVIRAGIGDGHRSRDFVCPEAPVEIREPDVDAVAASTHTRQPRGGTPATASTEGIATDEFEALVLSS
jgi:hypothetical protein